MIVYIISFIIFVLTLYIFYNLYFINRKHIYNKEFKEVDKDNRYKVEVYLFYASWCPHTKNILNKWNDITTEYKNHKLYDIKFIKINGDNDVSFTNSFGVKSYPSIYLKYNNVNYFYDAELDTDTFKTFIQTFVK